MRWENGRNALKSKYGTQQTSFLFGTIINLICPLTFCVQNFLLGFGINGGINRDILHHVRKSLRHQILVIYNINLLDVKIHIKERNKAKQYLRLSVGYFLYMLPVCLIGMLFLTVRTSRTICQPMKSKFLLDNNVNISIFNTTFGEIYKERNNYGKKHESENNGLG